MIYKRIIKPALDVTMACLLLIISFPFFLIIIIVLAFVNKGSPFFLQIRAGKHGKPFRIIKFKTMNDNRDEKGKLLPDSDRLTKPGLFLRKTSIDELPQLFNVVRGELSLVGPRPLLMQYLPYYNKDHATRHNVKPGITGWAQVKGRQSISFEKRFDLDVWYVNNISFILDVKILVRTSINVLKTKGVVENEDFWKK